MKQISKETKAANLDIFKAGSEVCFYMGQEQIAGHSAPFYVGVSRKWTNHHGRKQGALVEYKSHATRAQADAYLAELVEKYAA